MLSGWRILHRIYRPGQSLTSCGTACRTISSSLPRGASQDQTTTTTYSPDKGRSRSASKTEESPPHDTKANNSSQNPRKRPDWKYLPEWRRQTLSVKHKIQQQSPYRVLGDTAGNTQKPFWNPQKKISPDAMAGIRVLHKHNPEYNVPTLAKTFEVSPEVIRRILKSKWQPTAAEAAARDERWKKRKYKVLEAKKELEMR